MHPSKFSLPRARTKFSELLEVARLVKAYLAWRDSAPKVTLTGLRLKLATHLLGCAYKTEANGDRKVRFYRDKAFTEARLRAAGIDPVSWEIVDERRAAFAWEQLRESGYFKYKVQEELVNSPRATPDINAVIEFGEVDKERKNESFSSAIKERLNWSR